jgi:RimJ/RimL family protein N-acetyltransferase
MILLEKDQYAKLAEPLRQVTINNLFARAVVEDRANGTVYVDNTEDPKTFYVLHSYGMSLLFGDHTNEKFNAAFREYALNTQRERQEWMQAFPAAWDTTLERLFAGDLIRSGENKAAPDETKIELNTRVNFKFNPGQYRSYWKSSTAENLSMVRTDEKLFSSIKGSVIPFYFWKNAQDFYTNGIGFSLLDDGLHASTAYSAFIFDDQLEIGIETDEKFRGKGYAQLSCSALIDHCLENGYEPVWACRLENTGSYKLAQKLGFEPSAEIPYYKLCMKKQEPKSST